MSTRRNFSTGDIVFRTDCTGFHGPVLSLVMLLPSHGFSQRYMVSPAAREQQLGATDLARSLVATFIKGKLASP